MKTLVALSSLALAVSCVVDKEVETETAESDLSLVVTGPVFCYEPPTAVRVRGRTILNYACGSWRLYQTCAANEVAIQTSATGAYCYALSTCTDAKLTLAWGDSICSPNDPTKLAVCPWGGGALEWRYGSSSCVISSGNGNADVISRPAGA